MYDPSVKKKNILYELLLIKTNLYKKKKWNRVLQVCVCVFSCTFQSLFHPSDDSTRCLLHLAQEVIVTGGLRTFDLQHCQQ